MPTPIIIRSQPGIKRDGTEFEGDYYTDGLWTRFQRGLPRKVGGYTRLTNRLQEKVYGMSSFSAGSNNYVACGEGSFLEQLVIGNTGNVSAINDRTPIGFAADPNNLWQFSNWPSGVSTATDLVAHAAPNLLDIASQVETPIYIGQADLATPLVTTVPDLDPQSGGATTLGPYLFGYGNGGFVQWSQPGVTTFQAEARVTGQKICYGRPLRGGGSGPAGLFWSLDSLVRATFIAGADPTGSDPVFAFDELSTELSLLSSRSIVEYNGVFYWWDNSGPLMFNGVVREVPNNLNINFLLDNLNYTWRQKMYAMKIPRWGEIWWCVPLFGATECNWAIILNVRENTWYDTPLPSTFRTSGLYAQVYPKPFMTDADLTPTGYSFWQHETGTDAITGANVEPIPAFFQTADISTLTGDQPKDQALRVAIIEPDFVQSGDMTVEIVGKANARAPVDVSDPVTFPADDGSLSADEQIVRFKQNRREMRFKFASNTPGGNFEAGQSIAHVEPSDGRITT